MFLYTIVLSSINCTEKNNNLVTNQAALFVFGDSLFDAGNYKYIDNNSAFQSNFFPYGQTTFKFPTGRVSDGRLITDFIAENAWLPLIPPNLQPSNGNSQLTYGANFAFGGAGALVETFPGMPFKSAWSVRVKVIHKWTSFNHQTGATLEMVLADEKGHKIKAICNQTLLHLFEGQCVVGEWKVITNFQLVSATGLYRHTKHVYKMVFLQQTSITDCDIICHNMFLELQDFTNIINGPRDTSVLIDVIGEVLDFGGLQIAQVSRTEIKKVEFTLRDISDQRLKCCLTGKYAEILSQDVKQPTIGDICLIRFARTGIYKGELYLLNAFDSSLVFINPDIKEAQLLKQKFNDVDNSLGICQIPNDEILNQEKQKRWSQYPFLTIQEMKHFDKGENCRVICVVYAIDTVGGWYFVACVVCHNKVFKNMISFDDNGGQSWWCEFCHRNVTKISARYNLDLLVQDQTGESKVTLADSLAKYILKTSASKLVNVLLDEVENQNMLPPQLVEIVGKSYGFGISFDGKEKNSEDGVFNAMKVWTLSDAIWKKAKYLHKESINSKKKQCTIHICEVEESKSG